MAAILIVDDEYGLAEMVGDLLSSLGHSVALAINGKLALAMVEHRRPDVIFLDYMMPIVSGAEVLRALQADAANRDIKVILMSAADRSMISRDALDSAHGFLQKPFTFEEMMAALRRCLPDLA